MSKVWSAALDATVDLSHRLFPIRIAGRSGSGQQVIQQVLRTTPDVLPYGSGQNQQPTYTHGMDRMMLILGDKPVKRLVGSRSRNLLRRKHRMSALLTSLDSSGLLPIPGKPSDWPIVSRYYRDPDACVGNLLFPERLAIKASGGPVTQTRPACRIIAHQRASPTHLDRSSRLGSIAHRTKSQPVGSF
jgi:hypothetical protein